MWFIHNPERLKTEVTGIEALRASAPWLAVATPRMMKGLQFAVDFDMAVNGEALPFTLTYPAFFPETPPSVLPRDGRHYPRPYGRKTAYRLETARAAPGSSCGFRHSMV